MHKINFSNTCIKSYTDVDEYILEAIDSMQGVKSRQESPLLMSSTINTTSSSPIASSSSAAAAAAGPISQSQDNNRPDSSLDNYLNNLHHLNHHPDIRNVSFIDQDICTGSIHFNECLFLYLTIYIKKKSNLYICFL